MKIHFIDWTNNTDTENFGLMFFYIFFYFAIFILHSRESKLYRYILDGMSALAWELPFCDLSGPPVFHIKAEMSREVPCPRTQQANLPACSQQAGRQAEKLWIPFFKVFCYDSTRGLNPITWLQNNVRRRWFLAYKWKVFSNVKAVVSFNTSQLLGICYFGSILTPRKYDSAPINSPLNVVVWSATPFGLSRHGCWPSQGSQLPRALPSHKPFFRHVAPEQPHKGSTQLL